MSTYAGNTFGSMEYQSSSPSRSPVKTRNVKRKQPSITKPLPNLVEEDPNRPPDSGSSDDESSLRAKRHQRSADIRPTSFTRGSDPKRTVKAPAAKTACAGNTSSWGGVTEHRSSIMSKKTYGGSFGKKPTVKSQDADSSRESSVSGLVIPEAIPSCLDAMTSSKKAPARSRAAALEIPEEIPDFLSRPQKPPPAKHRAKLDTSCLAPLPFEMDAAAAKPAKKTRATYSVSAKEQSERHAKRAAAARALKEPSPPAARQPPSPKRVLKDFMEDTFFGAKNDFKPDMTDQTRQWIQEREAEEEKARQKQLVRGSATGTRLDADTDADTEEMVQCATCKKQVALARLENFAGGRYLSARRMVDFCEAHTRQDARTAWKAHGLPAAIAWGRLRARAVAHAPALEAILRDERASEFRAQLAEDVRLGRNKDIRTVRSTLGYYGIRGMLEVQEALYGALGARVRARAAQDKVVAARGWMFFVESVLVPETIRRFIMEDMCVDEEAAGALLRETTWIGDALSREVQEAVPVELLEANEEEEEDKEEEEEEEKEGDEEEEEEGDESESDMDEPDLAKQASTIKTMLETGFDPFAESDQE